MNKSIILTLAFLIWANFCQAFCLETNMWNDFEGKIGNQNVQLSLYLFQDGEIKGNYCYQKYGTKIQLVGQIKSVLIELTELIDGKANGYFNGKVYSDKLDRFDGRWTDIAKTKFFDFRLTLASICGGSFDHRYSDFSGTDNDVENFMKHIKTSILTNDKEWIANHISYPIKVNLGNKKKVGINNKKQLVANFDEIFHQKFKKEIKSFYPVNLFHNYMGAMLGQGAIWINNIVKSSNDKYEYYITAINN